MQNQNVLRPRSVFSAALVLVVLTLVGCGSGKSLFSSWRHTTTGAVIDLSDGSIGSFGITWVLTGGAQCSSSIQISGTEESGTFIITNSSYTSGGSGDPGCGSLNSAGTFSKTEDQLRICISSSCGTYE